MIETEWVHWNPGATQPLRVRLGVECNTSTEEIMDHIRRNAETVPTGWQKIEEAHDRTAILCGSGPSLADTLEEIRSLDGDVFAMNGAAAFLNRNGILPDYQVIMDARLETADLIGPAKQHLFASQVHPECFKRLPTAKLWHATHGDIEPEFPGYQADYCLIGGAVSVGNAALVLAWVMGYRSIHCFGFDSSHRGDAGHAFAQPLNAGDPTTIVEFGGKEYVASLTMRLQAHYFMERARQLEGEGVSIEMHGSGLLPDMFNSTPKTEREKYQAMWAHSAYRSTSPGEKVASAFVDVSDVDAMRTVLDLGCGTGRGGQKIHELTGARVTLVDFAPNCVDLDVKLSFETRDLCESIGLYADYAYCTDVMEHIPPAQVDQVLENVLACAPKAFFQISLVPDTMGSLIGKPLHLSVHSFEWWHDKLKALSSVKWWQNRGDTALFYVHSSTT